MKIEKDGRMLEIGIKYSENEKKGQNKNKEHSMRTQKRRERKRKVGNCITCAKSTQKRTTEAGKNVENNKRKKE